MGFYRRLWKKKKIFFPVRVKITYLAKLKVRYGNKILIKKSRNVTVRGSVCVLLGWKTNFGMGSGNFSNTHISKLSIFW